MAAADEAASRRCAWLVAAQPTDATDTRSMPPFPMWSADRASNLRHRLRNAVNPVRSQTVDTCLIRACGGSNGRRAEAANKAPELPLSGAKPTSG